MDDQKQSESADAFLRRLWIKEIRYRRIKDASLGMALLGISSYLALCAYLEYGAATYYLSAHDYAAHVEHIATANVLSTIGLGMFFVAAISFWKACLPASRTLVTPPPLGFAKLEKERDEKE
jgi:hypothetical protein